MTADHEARNAPELRERLRSGLWAFIRHTDLLRDVPGIVEEALEQKISLERTALTTDWALPPWIARHGLIDAAIKAAIGAGLAPQEAYACATRRPATYLGLDAHLGSVAPARLASLNVLPDLHEPRPERVFSLGREVAREGELLTEVPDVDWAGLGAPAWSRRRQSPVVETFCAREHDPSVFLESAAVLRQGAGADGGQPLVCVTIDPDADTYTRAWLHGLAPGLEGIASTLTPRRLLVAAGGDPAALARCVDEVMRHGGGIALHFDGGVHSLPLPVGGVVTAAPFEDVLGFWELAASTFASLGSRIADPLSALFYIASDSLPGARFNARGLVETRSGELLAPSRPIVWG